MKIRILSAVALASSVLPLIAAPLSESTFTEVIKEVNVVAATTKAAAPAKMNDLVKAPDLVRTGADSRAELTAPDQTITRVGANTVFSFEPAGRSLRLERGSLLFHSPSGKGGGTIKTGGASAAVLGTTIVVAATADGGFKFIVLEGTGRATLADGRFVTVRAGQMVFILPGGNGFSPVLDINLGTLVSGSQLINGFSHDLASIALIRTAVQKQNADLAKGKAQDTGISADNFAKSAKLNHGLNAVDHTAYGSAVHAPLTAAQIVLILQGNTPPAVGGINVVPVNGTPP